MKKIFLTLFIFTIGCTVLAEDIDYEQVYRDLPVPTVSFIHNIDPDEFYDMKNTTWSPYPLFRLTAPLYFKSITIQPGYYLLTPRKHEDNWYILFKEAGRVKYIIPAYERDLTPMNFYNENIPEPKFTFSQRVHLRTLDFVGKFVKSSKRKPAPETFLEIFDLDNNFISLVVYFGSHRYYMILRSVAL